VKPLDGKLAVVTGASRGIGSAIADQLLSAGVRHVVRLARTLPDKSDGRCTDLGCDVADAASVANAASQILGDQGVPDILVNNAGAFLLKPVEQTTFEEFQEQVDANLVGAFVVMREFLPHFRERDTGHIVNIGSIADHEAYPGNAAYGASKYGLRGLHETVKAELAGTNIRLSLISPGPTDTTLWDAMDPDARDDLPKRAAMLRPDDVAEAVLFAVTRPPHVSVDWMWVNPAH
jgi:NADP-dependent 3-hydroxy acid dehydrogenase YdfG